VVIEFEDISEQPLKPDICSEGPMHALRETSRGLLLGPSNFPLYLGLFFLPFIPTLWYMTKDAGVDPGLKLAAWLFPAFAACASFVGWGLMRVIATTLRFDRQNRRLQFSGIRFHGAAPIPFDHIVAIQVCYGGEQVFKGDNNTGYKIPVYELNVVYKQGEVTQRINLLCHGGCKILLEQAKRIAEEIGVPRVLAGPIPSETRPV